MPSFRASSRSLDICKVHHAIIHSHSNGRFVIIYYKRPASAFQAEHFVYVSKSRFIYIIVISQIRCKCNLFFKSEENGKKTKKIRENLGFFDRRPVRPEYLEAPPGRRFRASPRPPCRAKKEHPMGAPSVKKVLRFFVCGHNSSTCKA